MRARIDLLNKMVLPEAVEVLRACCGSRRWIHEMLACRPFDSEAALLAAAQETWERLGESDWREAFSAHPRIGAGVAGMHQAARWSAGEQGGVVGASHELRLHLVTANDAYFDKFGFIFIVCATGKTAEAMLALLEQRIGNSRERELRIAAQEQSRITELRLKKWLDA